MKYFSGEDVRIGDLVEVWSGCKGFVVCDFEKNLYSDSFKEEEWSYLEKGVLIDSDEGGVVHLESSNEDLKLICRSQKNGVVTLFS